jgi:hypothetical protein
MLGKRSLTKHWERFLVEIYIQIGEEERQYVALVVGFWLSRWIQPMFVDNDCVLWEEKEEDVDDDDDDDEDDDDSDEEEESVDEER